MSKDEVFKDMFGKKIEIGDFILIPDFIKERPMIGIYLVTALTKESIQTIGYRELPHKLKYNYLKRNWNRMVKLNRVPEDTFYEITKELEDPLK